MPLLLWAALGSLLGTLGATHMTLALYGLGLITLCFACVDPNRRRALSALLLSFTFFFVYMDHLVHQQAAWEKGIEGAQSLTGRGVLLQESLLQEGRLFFKGTLYQKHQPMNTQAVLLEIQKDYSQQYTALKALSSGTGIEIRGRLQAFQGQSNINGFNQKQFMWTKGCLSGIQIEGYTRVENLSNPIEKVRAAFGAWWAKRLYEHTALKQGPLCISIFLGEDAFLDPALIQDFQTSGTLHILTVSGAHFGILLLCLMWALDRLEAPYRLKYGVTFVLLFLFLWVIGMSASASRAYVMMAMLHLMARCYAQTDGLTALSLTVILLLLGWPPILYSMSFQLSLSAIFGLVAVVPMIQRTLTPKKPKQALEDERGKGTWVAPYLHQYILKPLIVSVGITLTMMPLIAQYFHGFSFWSLLYNIPVAWISAILMPLLALQGLTAFWSPLEMVFGLLTGCLLKLMSLLVSTVNYMPFRTLQMPALHSLDWMLIAYSGLLLALAQASRMPPFKRRWCYGHCLVTLISLVLIQWIHPTQGFAEVVFFDVGQGDGVFLRTAQNETFLIDGGKKRDFEDAATLVLHAGASKIDHWIISHFHDDHMGDYDHILSKLRIKDLWTRELAHSATRETPLFKAFMQDQSQSMHPRMGSIELKAGDSRGPVTVLWPPKGFRDEDLNDESLVLSMPLEGIQFLFTGDLTSKQECAIINPAPQMPTLLKVGHHGSRYSSSEAFLRQFKWVGAVISVGKNRYGHPSKDALERLEALKTPLYRLDYSGAVCLMVKDKVMYIKTLK